jgi:dipeptidyl aminopeptidase/acylaminoacyl peptidase
VSSDAEHFFYLDISSMKHIILLLFAFSVLGQSPKEKIQVTDLLKIKTAGKPIVSPKGDQFIYTVTSIVDDPDKKGDFVYQTHLHLGNLSTGETRALTSGKNSISSPVWSPDGSKIAFTRDMGSKSQVYVLDLAGGEPQAITSVPFAASNPLWSSNGKEIYFQSSFTLKEFLVDSVYNKKGWIPSWTLEKPMLSGIAKKAKVNPNGSLDEVRAYLAQNEVDKKAKVINRLNFQEEAATTSEIPLPALFKTTLTGKPELVNNPFQRWSDFEIAKNGIYASIPADSLAHPDKVLDSYIGLNNRVVYQKKGYRMSNLTLSPSEKWLAFQEAKSTGVQNATLNIISTSQPASPIKVSFDRVITQVKWSNDENTLYFTAQDQGGVPLFSYDLNSKEIKQLSTNSEGILGFDIASSGFIYAKTGIENPSEIYLKSSEAEKRFTSLNVEWLATKEIVKPIKHTFTNTKGQKVDYWVMKPTTYEAGKKYPLVLEIHGGPSAMWGTGEASMWHEFQYYAAKGMGVVYANPRGSGGYGTDYLAANVKDWGTGPTSDVMKAMDLAIAEGWADTTQLAVTGGSYAGYLVAWIVGHTNRFKVACAQRGVYELSTFMGEGNAWRLVPNYFGGYPWEKTTKAILDRESPYSYVQNIKTPLIIFHGENDLRTGVIQSEMLYKSLKVLGRDVEYVRHPGGTHELTRSGNNRQRIDQMLRTYEFFARYLKIQ